MSERVAVQSLLGGGNLFCCKQNHVSLVFSSHNISELRVAYLSQFQFLEIARSSEIALA